MPDMSSDDVRPMAAAARAAAGWAIGIGGVVAAVGAVSTLARPALWLAVLVAVLVALATVLAGVFAGIAAALVAALLTQVELTEEVEAHAELAVALGVGGASLALVAAAIAELRRRERERVGWLERLAQLSEALRDAPEAEDPFAAVQEAARAAAGATALELVPGAAAGSAGPAAPVEAEELRGHMVEVTSSGSPTLLLRARVGVLPSLSLKAEFEAFLRGVADQCGAALERAELVRAQRQASRDLELMARASTELSATLDLERVAAAVHHLLVPHAADECDLSVADVSRPGQAMAPAPDDGQTSRVELRDRGSVIGWLELRRRERPLNAAELRAAELVAEPAARSLAHALLFAEQVRTSATLEHSLLPAATLPVPNLEVATRYLAAAEGHAAGGDFYDVLQAPGGGAVLVVGDVQGKGVEAATLTSTARHTLRSAAIAGRDPGGMLAHLNAALLYGHRERRAATGEPTVRFVTAAVVSLTPTPTGFRAVVASGGHPPPLLVRPGGHVEQLVAVGPLLGVFEAPEYEQREAELGLADMLVLYTDGVTEQRDQPDLFDEAQLGRLVRNMLSQRTADAVARQILETVVVLNPREVRDDVALVVARVTGPR